MDDFGPGISAMLQVRRWFREFFSLSHAQANGLIILIPLLALLILSEPAWRWYIRHLPVDHAHDQAKLDSLVALWNADDSAYLPPKRVAPPHRRFYFDPNTTSGEQFLELGFTHALASRIVHYREKGGKFRVKGDLLKIYGMDTSFYRQLRPWIGLPELFRRAEKRKFTGKEYGPRPHAVPLTPFDVNLADTAQLSKIRGIGEKLSERIIRYREVLGGFVRMEQLTEVYGLDSAVTGNLAKYAFVAEHFQPKRMNVNTADAKMLAVHPYLTDKDARSIVAYRFQHGNFGSLDELGAIQVLTEETLLKILPYLTTTN